MRLTQFSDYALRVLMYAAAHPDRLVTITELASFHRISRSHLTKVVMHLASRGYLQSVRGRGGGLRLARDAASICVGEVLRSTEEDFQLVECFQGGSAACMLRLDCRLARELREALNAFFSKLDALTLADLHPTTSALYAPIVLKGPSPKSERSAEASTSLPPLVRRR
ncbi:MAG: Rrf2 family transcriptional regulator [Proteobacteria bacterium]|nr:Rrf2 family transcriptional regulator [Pseudomonadota bacterium]